MLVVAPACPSQGIFIFSFSVFYFGGLNDLHSLIGSFIVLSIYYQFIILSNVTKVQGQSVLRKKRS